MCLGVPGQILRIDESAIGMTMGVVSFGGVTKEICLAYVPEALVGDYVLVHVGFAISKIDEEHANDIWAALEEMGELSGAESPTKPDAS